MRFNAGPRSICLGVREHDLGPGNHDGGRRRHAKRLAYHTRSDRAYPVTASKEEVMKTAGTTIADGALKAQNLAGYIDAKSGRRLAFALFVILGAFAEFFSDNLAGHVRKARKERFEIGLHNGIHRSVTHHVPVQSVVPRPTPSASAA